MRRIKVSQFNGLQTAKAGHLLKLYQGEVELRAMRNVHCRSGALETRPGFVKTTEADSTPANWGKWPTLLYSFPPKTTGGGDITAPTEDYTPPDITTIPDTPPGNGELFDQIPCPGLDDPPTDGGEKQPPKK